MKISKPTLGKLETLTLIIHRYPKDFKIYQKLNLLKNQN